MQLNLQRTQGIANRIQAGFEKDEQVQVSENFLDKKNKQELIDLMQSLFDERAAALRKFIYELMKQKQRDLQELKEEFDP
jgi:exonuclease VII large subunit